MDQDNLHAGPVVWTPSPERIKRSYVTSLMKQMGVSDRKELWKKSVADLEAFWKTVDRDLGIEWQAPYHTVLDRSGGLAWTRWFVGGKLNLAQNCVDRHREKTKPALVWEGDGGEVRQVSYREFYENVNQAANALRELGVQPGEAVAIVMPMLPETVVQLFACFKIGAVAIPIFSGFGSEAIASRLTEAEVRVVFTVDGSYRRGKPIAVKASLDAALAMVSSVQKVIVVKRAAGNCPWHEGRDLWWDELVGGQSRVAVTAELDAEAHSLILFTSGTTGKPKGAIHTHAGSLATICKELRYSFNVDEKSRFFWFTDIGWMMGPWEMIGVTFFGGTLMLFEGAPDYPTPGRLWEFIERHAISHLGISPTAIRLLMRSGEAPLAGRNLDSLQVLGSTGEPWDPESYAWFFKHVGRGRCPIINISGGTEIIGCLLLPLPIDPLKACSLGGPGLGVDADVFDEDGNSVRGGIGHLVVKQPLPSMTKAFLKSKQRYLDTYFFRFPGVWYHGDWARVDDEGHWFLHGRSDDTIKIAGKRIGPVEFEAALLADARVSEAAAIGVPDSIKGEVGVCFAVLKPGITASEPLRAELTRRVEVAVGKSLAPKKILFVTTLPKTRSAKIVRAMIRRVYLGEPEGDTASIENLDSLAAIRTAR